MSPMLKDLVSVVATGDFPTSSLKVLDELVVEQRRLILDADLTDGGRHMKVIIELFYKALQVEVDASIALSIFTLSEQVSLTLETLEGSSPPPATGVVRGLRTLEKHLEAFLARLDVGYLRRVAALLETYSRVLRAEDKLKHWKLTQLYRRQLDRPTSKGYGKLYREALVLTQELKGHFALLLPEDELQVQEALTALEVQHLLSAYVKPRP